MKVVKFPRNAVCQLLTPVLGGAEQQCRMALLHSLKTQAHNVVIITLGRNSFPASMNYSATLRIAKTHSLLLQHNRLMLYDNFLVMFLISTVSVM